MIRLSSLIERFGQDFLDQFGHRLNADQMRALAALRRCRNAASVKMELACSGCEQRRLVPHSCGHRHCPHCQHHESQQWLQRQLEKQVPAEYFLLSFTLPAQLRAVCAANQKTLYALLMQASWDTVHSFSQNDRQLRGTPGAIAVLHTHTRRLDYHPHVHLVMPAAALDVDKRLWRTKLKRKRLVTQGGYLFNHKALAKVFRAKLLAAIAAVGLKLPAGTPSQWVVDCKSVGSGEKALVYLGRYLYRGVIREQDIVACGQGLVSFRYRDGKTGKLALRTVPGAQFLWLVLQHMLPKGFRRARNFGFLHPNRKRLIALMQVLLKIIPPALLATVKPRPAFVCTCCGAAMKVVRTRIHDAAVKPMPPPGDGGALPIM